MFEKFEDSYFIEFIFMKYSMFFFILINFMILNNLFTIKN